MIKKLLALVLAALMLMSVAACSNVPADSGNGGTDNAAKEPDLQTIKADIAAQLGITPSDMNTKLMVGMYGFPENGIADSASFTVDSPVFREEIFMIKATDEANADIVAQKLQGRLDSLKSQAQNYNPESAAILKDCSVIRNGNYVAMFFSDSRAAMESVYKSYF